MSNIMYQDNKRIIQPSICKSPKCFDFKCLIFDSSMCVEKLKCAKCFRSSCIICLKLIIDQIKKEDYDPWCYIVKLFINEKIIPFNFIGHCCEISNSMQGLKSTSNKSGKKQFDGWLFLPQLNLLIDSPLHGNINIHGFGKGDKMIPPLIHGVIGHTLSRYLYKVRFKPDTRNKNLLSSEKHPICFKDYFGKFNKIQIQLLIYRMDEHKYNHLTHLPVTYDHIKSACILGAIKCDIDVSIIICKSSIGDKYSLVRMRYHNLDIKVSTELSTDLLMELQQKISHGGYECIRTGGSSGFTQVNHNFYHFFKESNKNLPRCK